MPEYYPAPSIATDTLHVTADADVDGNLNVDGAAQVDGALVDSTSVATPLVKVTATPGAHAAAPDVGFGDLDTGFWESADDTLNVGVGGAAVGNWSSSGYASAGGKGITANGPLGVAYYVTQSAASPSSFTGTQTPLTLSTGAVVTPIVRLTTGGAGAATVYTFASGSAAGQLILFVNVGTVDSITFKHDDGATGTANQRFLCPNSADYILTKNSSCWAWYDAVDSRYRILGPVA